MKIDQYGNAVPGDLVLLDSPAVFTPEQINKLNSLDWYYPRGIRDSIFVSFAQIEQIITEEMDFYTPDEFGFDNCEWSILAPNEHQMDHRGFHCMPQIDKSKYDY